MLQEVRAIYFLDRPIIPRPWVAQINDLIHAIKLNHINAYKSFPLVLATSNI